MLATHRDFLLAGADLIRTNTYQATVEGYKRYLNLTEDESEDVFQRTINLALEAKREFQKDNPQKDIKVLASIGPYGAWLSDGSEYSGCYAESVADEVIRKFHKDRLDVIMRGSLVDGLAIETIPVQREAEIIVDLLNEFYPQTKFWVSFSCKVR